MAAAYAALVSLFNILHQILHPPPTHHYFRFPREHVDSLRHNVSSLIKFLECFPSIRIEEIKDVEARIVEAAHEAEDFIESDVVTQIHKQYTYRPAPRSYYHHDCRELKAALSKVMNFFITVREDLEEMKGEKDMRQRPDQNSTTSSSSKDIMIGFEEHLDQIRSVLTSSDSKRVIIPIVGMGGIGKTTLAKHVCREPIIIDRFSCFAWVRVSQEYKEKDNVRELLQQINSTKDQGKVLSGDALGHLLYKELFGKRYLIVLDDVWDIEAWDEVKRYLPDNKNGSRILVTTRLQNLIQRLGCGSSPHQMTLLDEEKSWKLINEYVKEDCPVELEETGRSIARECGGLPLALVAIGGLLAKSEKTRGFWKHVETNVTSIANYADGDKKCIETLRMSYSELPVHLKPCFLYLAVFPKHSEIRVSRLIRLWVAEGFIKPSEDNHETLENVAREYLKDLLDRNLVMTSKLGHDGKVIKKCSIHDLMRDLCTNEAENSKFLWFDIGINSEEFRIGQRFCIDTSGKKLRKGIHTRTLLSNSVLGRGRFASRLALIRPFDNRIHLLRVLEVVDPYSMDALSWLLNSRYITCTIPRELHVPCFVFVSMLWNLQTLVFSEPIALPSEFWQMSQLRHLIIPEITLTDPGNEYDHVVLENLQTLATVRDFTLSQNVVKRIKNVIKLGIDCMASERSTGSFGFSNVVYLDKLESLALKCRGGWENMGFPKSLRKLTLSYCQIPWEDMSVVGSLPNLEALKLRNRAARGPKWSPNEDEFAKLKFLLIDWCQLEIWEADNSHFPMLEQLQLVRVKMEEFPQDFADIGNLRTIVLNHCSEALHLSAKKMLENRDDDDITIRVFPPLEASRSRKRNLVGLEDAVELLKIYLLAESEKLDVISIVGKGGIGKTTLARELLFGDPKIQYEFPTRIWITASQEFSKKDMFLYIVKELAGLSDDTYRYHDTRDLALLAFEVLKHAKFLIVVDDLWSLDGWDHLRYALPKTGKVLITSRDMYVSRDFDPDINTYELHALSPEESWLLLCLEVFGKPEFPSKLEVQGKCIANQCGGLPLALVLVGGIIVKKLAESNEESALDYVSGSIFGVDSGYVSFEKVIALSYETLPHHLRKCFLFVGMFPRNYEIPAWKLIRLWIAEGFVQPEDNIISLEETAEKYLDRLINSNLLRVDKLNADGKVKTVDIHDLLRELCFKKVTEEGENFFDYVLMDHDDISEEQEYQRLCVQSDYIIFYNRPHCPSVRSLLCFSKESYFQIDTRVIANCFEDLRVLDITHSTLSSLSHDMYNLIHLRYLALSLSSAFVPASFSKFRNVQTLIILTTSSTLDVRPDIMNMIELRHFKTNASATLPNPTAAREGGGKIQTLGMISPKSCTEPVFDRARNLKKLGIRGKLALLLEDENRPFHRLAKLEDLQQLKLINDDDVYPLLTLPPAEIFPIKLRSLTLCRTALDWNYMSVLASLENLEVLKLKDNAFRGKSWEVTDGGFPLLQFLHIGCADLEMWVASDDHFPRLRHLVLHRCENLQQLPLWLANIPTFQNLDLHHCSPAAASSAKNMYQAKKMQEDQQQSTNVTFSLNVSPQESPPFTHLQDWYFLRGIKEDA